MRNLRKQYFKLMNANNQHEFLQEHPYIKYDLLELQELMLEAGYIMPNEDPVKALDVKSKGSFGMEAA